MYSLELKRFSITQMNFLSHYRVHTAVNPSRYCGQKAKISSRNILRSVVRDQWYCYSSQIFSSAFYDFFVMNLLKNRNIFDSHLRFSLLRQWFGNIRESRKADKVFQHFLELNIHGNNLITLLYDDGNQEMKEINEKTCAVHFLDIDLHDLFQKKSWMDRLNNFRTFGSKPMINDGWLWRSLFKNSM